MYSVTPPTLQAIAAVGPAPSLPAVIATPTGTVGATETAVGGAGGVVVSSVQDSVLPTPVAGVAG